jgi:hypothetical protein
MRRLRGARIQKPPAAPCLSLWSLIPQMGRTKRSGGRYGVMQRTIGEAFLGWEPHDEYARELWSPKPMARTQIDNLRPSNHCRPALKQKMTTLNRTVQRILRLLLRLRSPLSNAPLPKPSCPSPVTYLRGGIMDPFDRCSVQYHTVEPFVLNRCKCRPFDIRVDLSEEGNKLWTTAVLDSFAVLYSIQFNERHTYPRFHTSIVKFITIYTFSELMILE